MTAYQLIRKNSMGYESTLCTNGEWIGTKYARDAGSFILGRSIGTVRTWKTEAGARRYISDRPGYVAEVREAR